MMIRSASTGNHMAPAIESSVHKISIVTFECEAPLRVRADTRIPDSIGRMSEVEVNYRMWINKTLQIGIFTISRCLTTICVFLKLRE